MRTHEHKTEPGGEIIIPISEPPLAPGTWQHWIGLHFWVADLAAFDRPPQRGRHECTVRLQRGNPQIEEGITIDFVELAVRFWR